MRQPVIRCRAFPQLDRHRWVLWVALHRVGGSYRHGESEGSLRPVCHHFVTAAGDNGAPTEHPRKIVGVCRGPMTMPGWHVAGRERRTVPGGRSDRHLLFAIARTPRRGGWRASSSHGADAPDFVGEFGSQSVVLWTEHRGRSLPHLPRIPGNWSFRHVGWFPVVTSLYVRV